MNKNTVKVAEDIDWRSEVLVQPKAKSPTTASASRGRPPIIKTGLMSHKTAGVRAREHLHILRYLDEWTGGFKPQRKPANAATASGEGEKCTLGECIDFVTPSDGAGGDETKNIDNSFAHPNGIMGNITPGKSEYYFIDAQDGALPRLLFVFVPRRRRKCDDAEDSDEEDAASDAGSEEGAGPAGRVGQAGGAGPSGGAGAEQAGGVQLCDKAVDFQQRKFQEIHTQSWGSANEPPITEVVLSENAAVLHEIVSNGLCSLSCQEEDPFSDVIDKYEENVNILAHHAQMELNNTLGEINEKFQELKEVPEEDWVARPRWSFQPSTVAYRGALHMWLVSACIVRHLFNLQLTHDYNTGNEKAQEEVAKDTAARDKESSAAKSTPHSQMASPAVRFAELLTTELGRRPDASDTTITNANLKEIKGHRTWLAAATQVDAINTLAREGLVLEVERERMGSEPAAAEPVPVVPPVEPAADAPQGQARRMRPRLAQSGRDDPAEEPQAAASASSARPRKVPKPSRKHLTLVPWTEDSQPAVLVKRGGPMSVPGFKLLPLAEWPNNSFVQEVFRWKKFVSKKTGSKSG